MSRTKYSALEKLHLLEEFRNSGQSVKAFSRPRGLGNQTLQNWQSRYERDGIEGLKEARENNHYSKELKLCAVLAYLNGEGSLSEVTMRFGLRSHKQLQDWVNLYNGDKTLTASPFRKQVPIMSRKTTREERIEVVEYVTEGKHSYTEAATHFAVSYQQARSWVLKAREGGYEALTDNRGKHKDQKELTELDKANLRIRQLESELKDKKLIEAFAKKLLELQHKG